MDLGLDEQQEMLKNFARDFLEKECPEQLVRAMEEDEKGYSPELWQKMALIANLHTEGVNSHERSAR